MPTGKYAVVQIRFIIGPEFTDCYALIEADANCPHTVQGWYYKPFPASVAVDEFVRRTFQAPGGADDHVLCWARKAPPGIAPRVAG